MCNCGFWHLVWALRSEQKDFSTDGDVATCAVSDLIEKPQQPVGQ